MLDRIERHLDGALRPDADVEAVGPFELYVARPPVPSFARPRLGAQDVRSADVRAVLDRQRALDLPRALEWVHETIPSLLTAAREAGMSVGEHPLLVLEGRLLAPAHDVHLVTADDPLLAGVCAAVRVGSAHAGTAWGPVGVRERDASSPRPGALERRAARIADGSSVLVGIIDPVDGPVAGGSHDPRGDVTEVVGVGVLPAHRRRGLAAAVTSALARHALDHGVTTVFCGAQDDDVARVYERLGFRRVGTTCLASAD